MTVCVLAGGSGGAKLARGMLDVADDVVVVANTGDDVEIYGAYVSPDPDLVSFSLLDRLDPRGWGLRDDTFAVMDGLREIGVEVWFNLGDRDLAYSIERRRMLDAGDPLTEAQLAIGRGLDLPATVLPMSDDRVRTRVRTAGAWHDFQEFMIRLGGAAVDFDAVEGVELVGIEAARVTPEVAAAVGRADAIVIGPSNPVVSIGPILRVPGMSELLRDAAAPVVAVSPIVGGASVKGPTIGFLRWAGVPATGAGVASLYGDVLDGLVADEPCDGLPTRVLDTLMADAEGRRRVADAALSLARELRR